MADEIKLTAQMILHNTTNNHRVPFQPPSLSITQTNAGSFEATAALTTSDTTLTIVGLTTYGYGFFQNISASSTVVIQIGVDSTAVIRPFCRLKHKEFAIMRFVSGSTYRAETEASTGRLYYGVWED